MKQQISLREANQHLSRYVAAVQRGEEVIITRRGRPVAKLVAFNGKSRLTAEQKAAWKRLMAFSLPLGVRKWRREDLYRDV